MDDLAGHKNLRRALMDQDKGHLLQFQGLFIIIIFIDDDMCSKVL